MKLQENIEDQLHAESNELVNWTNTVLRRRINTNRQDFDRIKRAGAGGIGAELQR